MVSDAAVCDELQLVQGPQMSITDANEMRTSAKLTYKQMGIVSTTVNTCLTRRFLGMYGGVVPSLNTIKKAKRAEISAEANLAPVSMVANALAGTVV